MAEYRIIVLSNPVAGCEDEFNDWYAKVHLPDVCAVPGVVGARRFRSLDNDEWRYVAVYRLDCDDPRAVLGEILARWKTERMPGSDAFDESRLIMTLVEPL
jgi:hypothetical protein